MSSEQTPRPMGGAVPDDHGEPMPRRKRRPAVVAAVAAAAVLITGGGSAFLAVSSPPGAKPTGDPKPLVLDGSTGQESDRDDPAGTQPVYRTLGPLPEGPERARVYHAEGSVGRADVERLATAFGMSGSPELRDGIWRVGEEGTGPALQVEQAAVGDWWFSSGGRARDCDRAPQGDEVKTPECALAPDTPVSSGGSADGRKVPAEPVSKEQALKTAAPILDAAGLGAAEPDTFATTVGTRLVTTEPRIDGRPMLGWATTVEVGPDGPVSAHGSMAALKEGAEYPVVSADDALTALGKAPQPTTGEFQRCVPDQPKGPNAEATPGLPAEPEQDRPGTGGDPRTDGEDRITPCLPSRAQPLEVRKAVFGLSAQRVQGKPALVPSWLFTVAPKGSDATQELAQVAVDPKFLRTPADQPSNGPGEAPGDTPEDTPGGIPEDKDAPSKPTDPGPPPGAEQEVNVSWYSVDGRTLTLSFYGGVCHDYQVTVTEASDRVTVGVMGREKQPGRICILVAKEFTEKVTLDGALGERQVIDAATGERVPRAGAEQR